MPPGGPEPCEPDSREMPPLVGVTMCSPAPTSDQSASQLRNELATLHDLMEELEGLTAQVSADVVGHVAMDQQLRTLVGRAG